MSIFWWKHRRERNDRRRSAPGPAAVARDRLTVLLAHEGALGAKSDLLGLLRDNIVAAILRHVTLQPEQIQIKMHREASVSRLAIEVEIPV